MDQNTRMLVMQAVDEEQEETIQKSGLKWCKQKRNPSMLLGGFFCVTIGQTTFPADQVCDQICRKIFSVFN